MLHADQIEELITLVAAMDRCSVMEQIRNYRASFPVDFTREFLEDQSMDRLRHLLFALCIQQQRLPIPTEMVEAA